MASLSKKKNTVINTKMLQQFNQNKLKRQIYQQTNEKVHPAMVVAPHKRNGDVIALSTAAKAQTERIDEELDDIPLKDTKLSMVENNRDYNAEKNISSVNNEMNSLCALV